MCIGVVKNDLMVRTGIERYDEALKRKGARPMDFTGRVSKGMVYVGPEGVAGAAALRRWVEIGLAGAREATAATVVTLERRRSSGVWRARRRKVELLSRHVRV